MDNENNESELLDALAALADEEEDTTETCHKCGGECGQWEYTDGWRSAWDECDECAGTGRVPFEL